jgi:hypothetical protein
MGIKHSSGEYQTFVLMTFMDSLEAFSLSTSDVQRGLKR